MLKIIKKWGNSLVIRFDPEDIEILKIKEGQIVEIKVSPTDKFENKVNEKIQ
jgi:antitoxin component of MazEF toxin-antitoxin module